jgi:hypothetical protein
MDIGSRLCPFVTGDTLVAGSAFAQAPNPAPTPVAPRSTRLKVRLRPARQPRT